MNDFANETYNALKDRFHAARLAKDKDTAKAASEAAGELLESIKAKGDDYAETITGRLRSAATSTST